MKFVLALVVLLHLGCSVKSNVELSTEIIRRLEHLNELYRVNGVNITSTDTVLVPSTDMITKASSCVGVFVRELKHLLDNVTVHVNNKNILKELQANLVDLGPHQERDQECRMTPRGNSLKPFKLHANFLRRLNALKKI